MRLAPRLVAFATVLGALPALLTAQPASGAGGGVSAAAKATIASADKGRTFGADGAPIWVVVMSDFQCPYCKRWHDDVDATLRRNYVQTGKVKLAFLNYPLGSHRHAVPMAEAAMCAAAQGKFWPFHDAVFAAQTAWSAAESVTATIDSIGRTVGVDDAAFRTCRTERQTKLLVEDDNRRLKKSISALQMCNEDGESSLSSEEDSGSEEGTIHFQDAMEMLEEYHPKVVLALKSSKSTNLDLRNVLLLDNQSTFDLCCNKTFASKIIKADNTLSMTSNGGGLKITEKCKIPGYKYLVWYSKKAITNIICLKNLIKGGRGDRTQNLSSI